MQLTPYVDSIRRDLTSAAEVAGDEARATAERLTTALDAAVRLAIIDALSEAAAEVTRELAPGSVEVRIRAREPEFVVTPPPPPQAFEDEEGRGRHGSSLWSLAQQGLDFAAKVAVPPSPPNAPAPPDADEPQGTSRLTLRMPESLKNRVEEAANAEGISVNAWLVRVIGMALDGGDVPPNRDRSGRRAGRRSGRGSFGPGTSYTGWAR